MSHKRFLRLLKRMGACSEAMAWVRAHKYGSRAAWMRCRRAEWMGWFCWKARVDLWPSLSPRSCREFRSGLDYDELLEILEICEYKNF